jgi:hypothetical protein
MTEEVERTVKGEVDVIFHYKLVRVTDRKHNDEYNVLYVTIKDFDGKEIQFNRVLGSSDEGVENILKELQKLNKFMTFGYQNDKILEGIKEEFLKEIAILLWKW